MWGDRSEESLGWGPSVSSTGGNSSADGVSLTDGASLADGVSLVGGGSVAGGISFTIDVSFADRSSCFETSSCPSRRCSRRVDTQNAVSYAPANTRGRITAREVEGK